jgi:class 3 adenylate cyclase
MEAPEVRYAKSGDVNIAYAVVGEGPFDLVFVVGSVFTTLEYAWDGPPAEFFSRLASCSRARMNAHLDVRHVLPALQTPTLVLHWRDEHVFELAEAEYLADHIPGAELVVLEGADHAWFVKPEPIAREIERFLTGVWERGEWNAFEPDRVLATILFTDIVDSTAKAAELGDARWRELLQQHHALVRRNLARFQGREMDTAGDGFFASFDGPARAIRCADAITKAVGELGLSVRAGLHTGECEAVDDKIGGIAVHIGARVAKEAGPGEVLVSGTVRDLVAGSGLDFEERGVAELKGVPGEWRLYALSDAGAAASA